MDPFRDQLFSFPHLLGATSLGSFKPEVLKSAYCSQGNHLFDGDNEFIAEEPSGTPRK